MSDLNFQVARIVYFTDITRASAPVIPLGVLSEVTTSKVHGLALKARTELTAGELAQILAPLRPAIADPFAYFKVEFEDAWNNARPGQALTYLCGRHRSSLSVLAPKDCAEKSWLSLLSLHPRNEAIEAKLATAVSKEYDHLRADHASETDPQQLIIESHRRAAA